MARRTLPIRRALGRACAAGLALGLAASSAAAELDREAVLRGLQAWLDGTRDLEGHFEQTLVSGALGANVQEEGRVSLLRPGRMRWDYSQPERKVAIVNEQRTWLYLEQEKQLVLGELSSGDDLLATLLTAARPLEELFEVSLAAPTGSPGAGAYELRLAPRAETEILQQAVVRARPPDFAIEQVEVIDGGGNRMTYRFRDLRRNRGVSARRFDFDPPPGTAITGSHSSVETRQGE